MPKLALSYSFLPLILTAIFLSSCSDERDLKSPLPPKSGLFYDNPIDYINSIRLDAKLNRLKINPNLELSAQNHAKYTFINSVETHTEFENMQGFTGKSPTDRAQRVGYSSYVSENLSINSKSALESINGLMSAIYHRFTFLDTKIDEIGYGNFGDKNRLNFVYNMGNSKIDSFCNSQLSDSGYGKFYTRICKNEKIAILEDKFNSFTRLNLTEFVYYPNKDNIKPFFSRETPDPIPECKITSNPVSIEFDTSQKPISMVNFKIFDGKNELKNTKILTQANDINSILTKFQFAIFSKDVFKFDYDYRAEFEYIQGAENKKIIWNFKTSTPKYPYFIVENGDKLEVKPDIWYDIFIKPDNCNDTFSKYSISYFWMKKPEIDTIDTNSIRVRISGVKGAKVEFNTDNGKKFTLVLTQSSARLSIYDYKEYIFALFAIILIGFYIVIKRRKW